MLRFIIKLKPLHDKTGLTPYRVAKLTKVNQTTVRKYLETDRVEADKLEMTVITLIRFYGADWRDPSIVELVEVEEESEGQIKTPLLSA